MFEAIETHTNSNIYFALRNNDLVHLHSDGQVLPTPEYWPTRELAQAVLDKYQPEVQTQAQVAWRLFRRQALSPQCQLRRWPAHQPEVQTQAQIAWEEAVAEYDVTKTITDKAWKKVEKTADVLAYIKTQPKPRHVWKHGDVFRSSSGHDMMYIKIHDVSLVIDFNQAAGFSRDLCTKICLIGATFLFNIREKL